MFCTPISKLKKKKYKKLLLKVIAQFFSQHDVLIDNVFLSIVSEPQLHA